MKKLLALLCLVPLLSSAAIVDYTYTVANEVTVTPPTATGGPSCAGASAEGGAADEYIIRDNAGFAELADVNYEKFFLCPGDYTGAGTTTITRNCSEGTPCWLVYYNATDPGTHPGTWAWNSADRTHLTRIDLNGASWWRFVRVQWGLFNPTFTPGAAIPKDGAAGTTLIPTCSRPDQGSTDIIFDQILCEGFTSHGMGSKTAGSNDRITLKKSVVRFPHIEDNKDSNCIAIFSSVDFYAISNEVYDCTDAFHLENPGAFGTIIENNDIYLSSRIWVDCASSTTAPVQDNNGECACWENFIDLKDVGDSINDAVTLIAGNRFHGGREVHQDATSCGGSGGGGQMIQKSNAAEDAWRVNIINNMAWDYKSAGGSTNDAVFWNNVGGVSRNFSVIGNVMDISGAPAKSAMRPGFQDAEIYLNTVIGAAAWTRYSTGGGQSTEALCNTLIDVADGIAGATPPAGSKIGYNAFIASGAEEEVGFAGTNYEQATLANMNFDDLRINYNLITGSPDQYTFTDIVPSATTPAAYLNLCPGTGDGDTMGSRAGMGVDDVQADWE